MVVYIILTAITCLALYSSQKFNRHYVFITDTRKRLKSKEQSGFFITFLILSVFASVRDGVGCDYLSYVIHIEKIQTGMPHYMEIGFKWVVEQIAKIDSNPRIVIIVFAIATCFFYLKAIWEQSDDVLFSVFLFLTWGYYFMTFNTIRNYFALSVALFSIKYLNDKKYFRFVLAIVIAALFHKSALVCIPLYLLAKKDYKIKHLPILFGFIVTAILFRNPISSLLFQIYPSYEGSAYDTGRVSYLNIVKAVVVIVLCCIYWTKIKDDKLTRMYFNLNVFALVLYTAFFWLPEISRIGFYMNASTILLLPRLSQKVGMVNKVPLKLLICAFSGVLFILLLISFSSETTRLLPYKTWLFNGTF